MRITHLERFLSSPVGPAFLEMFKKIGPIDTSDKFIPEPFFDKVFTPEFVSHATTDPLEPHTERSQRKLDISLVHHMYHLWKDRNYFDISPQLCSKLLETDLRDLDTFFLRTPFRSMYVSLPPGNGMTIANAYTGKHELKGIYVLFEDFGTPHTTTVQSTGERVEGVTKYMHILAAGEEKGIYDDAVMFFHLLFWEGKLSESIAKSKKFLPQNCDMWGEIEVVFSFLVKVLLYLNCANVSIQEIAGLDLEKKLAGLKNPAKKRKLLQRYEKISSKAHKLLDILVDHSNLVPGSKQGPGGSGRVLGPKELERVRGHFKVQHFGEKNLQSRIIWVEPYSRGEGAEHFREDHRYKMV